MFHLDRRHLEENEGEHSKNDRLDEPDEYLEKHERQRQDIRHEMEHHREEYLAREHIAEQTKGKGDNLPRLAHQFEDADSSTDNIGLMERTDEKLLAILRDTECRNTRHLHREHRDERQNDGEIQISRCAPEERNDSRMRPLTMEESHRPETWQKPDPVGDEHKEENSRDKREKLPRLLFVLRHALDQVEECFENNLHHIL